MGFNDHVANLKITFSNSLTDALWDAGYQMGLRGLFRVPWHNIWGILAQVGMGQHGLGYSVIQMVVLYHNGKISFFL